MALIPPASGRVAYVNCSPAARFGLVVFRTRVVQMCEACSSADMTRESGTDLLATLNASRLLAQEVEVEPGADLDLSGLLQAWGRGDVGARDRLVPLVYQELRRRAAAYLRRERVGHTLQPTALVHEAFLRLVRQDHPAWQNRSQFFGVASQMMRRILVDRARTRKGTRRSGQWVRIPMDEVHAPRPSLDVDLIDLDDALTELAGFDLRMSQVAELRFFTGLTLQESADVLGISIATVEREWQTARTWLYARLTKGPRDDA